MKTLFPILFLSALMLGCQQAYSPADEAEIEAPALNVLAPAELADGWQLLFDGRSMEHWRGYEQDSMPPGWQIIDGAMANVEPAHGGDIVTLEKYADFELEMEWMVPTDGNSGIMFHVTEDHGAPWATGPEMQVADDSSLDGESNKNSAGSNYDVHAPAQFVTRPAGTWNHVRLVVDGPRVEHWMNGVKIVEYELWSEEWKEAVARSKWANYPDYGLRETGHIALQGDHTAVSYRNIKIRRL